VKVRLIAHLFHRHVDGTAVIVERTPGDRWETVRFSLPQELGRYVVEKGSITVDGVSLTVAAVHDDGFQVAVIPHTLAVTTLGARVSGARVNLEVDLVARYVERILAPG